MGWASQVMIMCDDKCAGRCSGLFIWSALVQATTGLVLLELSYIHILLANSHQKFSSRNLSICLFNPPDSSQKQRWWCELPLAWCLCSPRGGCVILLVLSEPLTLLLQLLWGRRSTTTQHMSFGHAVELDTDITQLSVGWVVPFLINLRASLLVLAFLSAEQAFSRHFPYYPDLFHPHPMIMCV